MVALLFGRDVEFDMFNADRDFDLITNVISLFLILAPSVPWVSLRQRWYSSLAL